MAIFQFYCNMCGQELESRGTYKETENTECPLCKAKMVRLFKPGDTSFQIRWGKPKVRARAKRMGG